jgi:hypothetical protein
MIFSSFFWDTIVISCPLKKIWKHYTYLVSGRKPSELHFSSSTSPPKSSGGLADEGSMTEAMNDPAASSGVLKNNKK